jgi:hypothetical protein
MPLDCAALLPLCLLLSHVPLARAQINAKMYTRLACPSVAHRWLASNYYVNSTAWQDSVPGNSTRHDGLLKNTDTSPIQPPFFDFGQNAMVFSPRSLTTTVGPYVQLPSVEFGTRDFTFYVLAKYNSPGTSRQSWPRIFDFSSTGTSSGVYFILTQYGDTNAIYATVGSSGTEASMCTHDESKVTVDHYQGFCNFSSYTAGTAADFTTTWQAGVWAQVAFVYRYTTNVTTMYWNGARVLDRSTPNVAANLLNKTLTYTYFGKSQYQDAMLSGAIADAQLYTEALTDSHIANLMSGGDATGCPSSSLTVAMCPSTTTCAPSNVNNTIVQLRLNGTDTANRLTCQQQCAVARGCIGIVYWSSNATNSTNSTYNCELRNDLSGSGTSALATTCAPSAAAAAAASGPGVPSR